MFLASLVKVSVTNMHNIEQTMSFLPPMFHACSKALLYKCSLLTQKGSLWFLRNSHVVGVGDLMDSPCEQDNTEQILIKLAFHGNGAEHG